MTTTPAFASKSVLPAIALTAIAALTFLGQTNSANAKSVLSCDGGSMRSVVECCETIVARKGMPMWMKQTGRNCSTSAVCRGNGGAGSGPLTHAVAPSRWCKIAVQYPQDRDNGGKDRSNGGKSRDANGSPTN